MPWARAHLIPWAPAALGAAGAAAYVAARPMSADLAAHTYRADLFAREGFAIWDGMWYGGHHLPGYSVLFPPVAAALGPRAAGALGAVAAAALFAALAAGRWGARGRLGALWFAAGTTSVLLSGRLTFAFGLALGLAALLALQRDRLGLALALAAVTALASPVAALFVAVAGAALAVRGPWGGGRVARRGAGAGLVAAALAPVVVLALAFPEGGTEPFGLATWWPLIALAVGALALLPAHERALRAGAVVYALAATAALLVPSPVGSNIARLGPLVAGPLLACAVAPRRRWALILLAPALIAWQWDAGLRDVHTAAGDPSTERAYYAPLLAFFARQGGPPGRLEIPFTRNHWEAAYVAPHFPLARGWERQLDRRYDRLLYRRRLSPAAYRRWLDGLGVRWVALPDARLDHSAQAERRLLARGLPYLRPAWRGRHWRVWALRRPAPLARGPAAVTAYRPDELVLHARGPGRVRLSVRWTPYWALAAGAGCVREAPGGWTELRLRRGGGVRLATAFAPGRIGARGPRCTPGATG